MCVEIDIHTLSLTHTHNCSLMKLCENFLFSLQTRFICIRAAHHRQADMRPFIRFMAPIMKIYRKTIWTNAISHHHKSILTSRKRLMVGREGGGGGEKRSEGEGK